MRHWGREGQRENHYGTKNENLTIFLNCLAQICIVTGIIMSLSNPLNIYNETLKKIVFILLKRYSSEFI